jgi:hypothetical protein
MALLIVRSQRGEPGPIRITATSEGLQPADMTIAATVK